MIPSSEQIAAVIPAAGKSGRMGVPKLFLPFDNENSFAEYLTSRYLDFGCSKIVLVVNPDDFAEIEKRQLCFSEKIRIVINDQPELGRFRSVCLGLKQLSSASACFLQNIDNPFAGNEVLKSLCSTVSADSVSIPVYEGHRGHPVLLGSGIWPQLLLQNDNSAILRHELLKFTTIETAVMNPDVLVNINSPEEYFAYFGRKISG